jgi:hypothetical protein
MDKLILNQEDLNKLVFLLNEIPRKWSQPCFMLLDELIRAAQPAKPAPKEKKDEHK